MILLSKNTTNRLALTLNELSSIYSTGGTPYFLFEFVNSQSRDATFFNPIIVSANTRVNVFEIIDFATANLTAGTVNLVSGYYEYKIYDQIQRYNLSLTGVTSCVEYGKAFVEFNEVSNPTYTGNTTTNNVYYKSNE